MKSRRDSTSSLELFLDTICNMFGGILFIAILVAIQIRQTTDAVAEKSALSPEEIAELQMNLTALTTEIESATVLRETIKKTMTQPSTEEELRKREEFDQLTDAKDEAVQEQTQLLSELLAIEKETVDLEKKNQEIDRRLLAAQNLETALLRELQTQKDENQHLEQTVEEMQEKIERLTDQSAIKELLAQERQENANRQEKLYLPKLHATQTTETDSWVLRYNRLYDVTQRDDFTGVITNELGVPKSDRGMMVDAPDFSQQFEQVLQTLDKNRQTVTVLVYGDSADSFYKVRDIIIAAGFEYVLLPSSDDAAWTLGEKGRDRDVQ